MTKLDDMLKQWPMREPSQLEVDESAERVTAAVSAGQMPASIDESILAAPLPKTSEEGQTSAPRTSRPSVSAPATAAVENKMSKDRTRDRTSFQELAKLASTTPPPPTASSSGSAAPPPASISGAVVRGKEADSSDSGIVDLKMMAVMDPSASERAQSTPLAASGLFEDESAPPKPAVNAAVAQQALASSASAPPPSSSAAQAVAQTAPAAASSAKSAVASLAPKKVEEKKGGGGVVIVLGALVAAAAIAAGGFFFIKHQRAAQPAVAVTTAAAPPTTAPAKATATTGPVASIAITDTQEQGDNSVAVDPSQAGKPSMGKYHAKSGGPVATATAGGDTTPAPTGTIDPKLVANIPTGGAGGSGGDLQEAMKTAANGGTGLGNNAQQAANTQAAGNVAQRPSQGQVAGAIGSVMPAAKQCLNGDEPMSRATVTFQSDGTVKSVNVTGFAAGKPQEACIKAALSKATVAPFAEATYPVPVTIRAN